MKKPPCLPIPCRLLLVYVFFCCIPGILSTNLVTLGSIEIYTTHEWFPSKPTIYFYCQGENKTILPDVKQTNLLYTFKGEESWQWCKPNAGCECWPKKFCADQHMTRSRNHCFKAINGHASSCLQPLTELPVKKCKRCGVYEEDAIKSDDVFDEWELCPDDFVDGKYSHFKEKEFNATFICLECTASAESTRIASSDSQGAVKKPNVALVIIVCILASVVTVIGIVAAYKFWQKRKREQDQARFLKLFEEGDDIEDELGIGPVL